MNLSFLPLQIQIAVNRLNLSDLSEIRLKSGQPVIIQYRGEYKYLKQRDGEIVLCYNAQEILTSALGKDVYTYSEQLKFGFVTLDGGIRIGVGGEYVTQNDDIISVREVTSLNIRLPHEVVGCASAIYNSITKDGFKSTIIFSPAGFGKTTILRDLIRLVSTNAKKIILIADERNEICGIYNGRTSFEVGNFCDVVRGANKHFVFKNAVRTLSPQIIATDELFGESDYLSISFLNECGIDFIATSHCMDKNILLTTRAEYFVELTGVGKRAIVYDKNFNYICDCNTIGSVRGSPF